ncbi:amino acid ABC transporter permease [Caproiciproducens sp. NJN-50]|uniref:amino acid ABC transporter permease n=2 Tax=Acutalibacteraceae TaxID=3082771 RepID=UPI000FFE15AF|nr:amino acid ABC transporter permease [Caproiciproducens sp. NJN-50]QAT50415.1 amino acid ABC transporter permease [Caproiciproducens sp. NJN-50]
MFQFRTDRFFESFPKIFASLGLTFSIVLLSILFGSALGLMLAWMKLGKNAVLKKAAFGYTTILRCTPTLVLIFIIYYGLPKLVRSLFGIDINDWSRFFFIVVSFSLYCGNILSEVMRSAYEAVGKGQFEAAATVGLTGFQAFRRIIFPQAFYISLPNVGNSLIGMLKESSLASTIGLNEITGTAALIIARRNGSCTLETYLALALIYWAICVLIEQLVKQSENHFGRFHQPVKKEV